MRNAGLCMTLARRAYGAVPAPIRRNPLVHRIADRVLDERFFTDALYRTELLLYPCFLLNFLYAAMQMVLGICFRSVWFGALSVYHAMLAVMRVHLARPMHANDEMEAYCIELKRYRFCGIVLLCMTPVLAGIRILVVRKHVTARYPGFTIVIMAVYTAFHTISALYNLLKFRKYQHPAMSAAKVVCLTSAMMSGLSLTTAIVARIGDAMPNVLRQVILISASSGISLAVLGMAVFMIVHAAKQFKSQRL